MGVRSWLDFQLAYIRARLWLWFKYRDAISSRGKSSDNHWPWSGQTLSVDELRLVYACMGDVASQVVGDGPESFSLQRKLLQAARAETLPAFVSLWISLDEYVVLRRVFSDVLQRLPMNLAELEQLQVSSEEKNRLAELHPYRSKLVEMEKGYQAEISDLMFRRQRHQKYIERLKRRDRYRR